MFLGLEKGSDANRTVRHLSGGPHAPEIGFSVLKLLESAGYEVMVPEAQTCCGQPAYNSGERAVSRDLAEKFLREFEMFDYVVVPSGSCGGMIRQHYQDLLRDDPELHGRYERLRERVFELTDFLVNVAKIDRFDSTLPAMSPITIPVPACASWASSSSHASCWASCRA
jgi:Fe-S oxidoreductase